MGKGTEMTDTKKRLTVADFLVGLTPLDEAIAKYPDEVIGGDGILLTDLRKHYPTQVIYVEVRGFYPDDYPGADKTYPTAPDAATAERWAEDAKRWAGRPFIETAVTDITDVPPLPLGEVMASDDGRGIPHGDEMAVFRVEDRTYVWTWYD